MTDNTTTRLYFDSNTGDVFLQMQMYTVTTLEDDYNTFNVLRERVGGSYDYVDIPNADFLKNMEGVSIVRVDTSTKELIYTYRDTENDNEVSVTKPLTQTVTELELKIKTQEQAIAELTTLVAMTMV